MKLELTKEEIETLLYFLVYSNDDTINSGDEIKLLNLISTIEYQYGKSKL